MIGTAYYRHSNGSCPNCGTVVAPEKEYTTCPLCETVFTEFVILEGGKEMEIENN